MQDIAVNKDNHTDVVTDEAVAPGCGSTGLTEGSHCEACGNTVVKQETVAATGKHSFKATGYTWADDGSACEAGAKCENCDATTTATGKITGAEKTAATCTEKGWTTYTATFNADWAADQTKDVQDIPVADHSFTTKPSTTVHTPGNCQTETLYKAQCDNCTAISDTVTVKGEKVADSHASDKIAYKNITDETHDEYHECCDILIDDLVEHTYTNGFCACGAKEPVPAGMKGDLDLDGDVDAADLTLLAQHVAGIEELTGQALENADVDTSGDVSAEDMTVHAGYIAGIITEWP